MKPGSKIRVILYKLKKSFVLDILPTQKKTKRKRKLHIYTVYIYIYDFSTFLVEFPNFHQYTENHPHVHTMYNVLPKCTK